MSVRVQSILALKFYVVAYGDRGKCPGHALRGLRAAHTLLGGVSGCYFTNDNLDSNNTSLQGEGSIRGGNEATNNTPRWGEKKHSGLWGPP